MFYSTASPGPPATETVSRTPNGGDENKRTGLQEKQDKTAVEDRNESFVPLLWVEDCFGSLAFGVKSFDCANREMGAPGNHFLPLKTGISGRAGVSPA